MRAVTVHGAGDLRVDDVPVPEAGPGTALVDIVYGGVCGSDLHYYHRGAVGDFTLREPLVVGHEVVGRVRSAPGWEPGTPVAVHPATPCDRCPECLSGRRNICRDTRYLGSAARFPHIQGGFRDVLAVPVGQLRAVPEGVDLRLAAVAEPLAVATHAVGRAGEVRGRRCLVTGAGPIGALTVAVLAARGAAEIVVSDLAPAALAVARAVGATHTVLASDLADDPAVVDVDVAVEASGSAPGLTAAINATRRGGTVVQLGLLPPGTTPFPGNLLVTREVELRGAFRFDHELDEALALLAGGLPVAPVITHEMAVEDAVAAFDTAGDRAVASKVLLHFR
jgi:L-idonate 5-dehydrogenase